MKDYNRINANAKEEDAAAIAGGKNKRAVKQGVKLRKLLTPFRMTFLRELFLPYLNQVCVVSVLP